MTEEKLEVGEVIMSLVLLVRECRGEVKGGGRDVHIALSGAPDAKTARGDSGERRGTDKRNRGHLRCRGQDDNSTQF